MEAIEKGRSGEELDKTKDSFVIFSEFSLLNVLCDLGAWIYAPLSVPQSPPLR